jgi:hypothetical protein
MQRIFAMTKVSRPPDARALDNIALETADHRVTGIATLRDENSRLTTQRRRFQQDNALLKSENEVLRRLLEVETADRRNLERLSIEVATSLQLVGRVCNRVISKAQQDAFRLNGPTSCEAVADRENVRSDH